VLALIEFWKEILELLLPLVVKALASKVSQEDIHVHGRDIEADWMIKNHTIINVLTLPGGYSASLWVQFEVLDIPGEFRPGYTMHIRFGHSMTGHGNGFRGLYLVPKMILLKRIPRWIIRWHRVSQSGHYCHCSLEDKLVLSKIVVMSGHSQADSNTMLMDAQTSHSAHMGTVL
jgi:hypothetical protein